MKYFIGNLKANLISAKEREQYLNSLKKVMSGKRFKDLKMILCPPSIHLEVFVKEVKKLKILIGAQNIFWEKSGPYTGEITAWMVKNLGIDYTLIGHSERRRYFGEAGQLISLKMRAALLAGLNAVLCIGESREERDNGQTVQILSTQLEEGLNQITAARLGQIVIAYEPVWSVGTDIVPTCDEVMEAKIIIRKFLVSRYGLVHAQKVPILYGGSVKLANVKKLCLEPEMDGVLVGRESLSPKEFIKIAQSLEMKQSNYCRN